MNSVAMLVSFAGFRTVTVCLQLRDYATSAESREPKGAPAVAGVDQGPRIRGPRRLYIVAGFMGESVRLASVLTAKPKVPVAAVELAVGQPAAVWRR